MVHDFIPDCRCRDVKSSIHGRYFFPAQNTSTNRETTVRQVGARVFQEPATPTAKATSLSGGLLSNGEADSDFNVFSGGFFQSVVSYSGNIRRNFIPGLIPHEKTHYYRVIK